MSSGRWLAATYGCLALALVPVYVGNAFVEDGVRVPGVAISVPFLALIGAAGACLWRWSITNEREHRKRLDEIWRQVTSEPDRDATDAEFALGYAAEKPRWVELARRLD
jgi:hypothetical protein